MHHDTIQIAQHHHIVYIHIRNLFAVFIIKGMWLCREKFILNAFIYHKSLTHSKTSTHFKCQQDIITDVA